MDKSDGDTMAAKREAVARAERAFKLFDKDNDGYITKDEFQKISKKLSKEQVRRGKSTKSALKKGRLNKDSKTIVASKRKKCLDCRGIVRLLVKLNHFEFWPYVFV